MKKRFQKNILKFLLLSFIISLTGFGMGSAQTQPPDFLWAESIGGNGYDQATDITTDINGDIITVGSFEDTVNFGGITLHSLGSSDIFVAKYNNTGTEIWALREGGIDYDQALSVTTDNLGNIIVTGIFSGTVSFETAVLTSQGNYDIFTAKYDTNGAMLWVHQGGGEGYDYGYEVTTDNLNNVIITGTYEQVANFDSISVQSGNPYGDIYVVKYNSLGAVQWVHNAYNQTGGQSFYNISYGAATDLNNDVFITGSFSGSITFGTSTTLVSSFDGTNADIFLAKYDSQGNFIWVEQAGSDSSGIYAYGNDIKIDKDNNILFTGRFQKEVNFGILSLSGLENSDIFIAKYDQSGNPLWAVQDHASIFYNVGNEIDLDDAGNISLIGEVSQDQTGGELNDVYFARYLNTGEKLWGQRAGIINSANAGGIANDSKGDIYGCGYFNISGLFGTHTLNGVNGEAFIGKIPSPKFILNPNPLDFGSQPILSFDSTSSVLNNISGANLHIITVLPIQDTSEAFFYIPGDLSGNFLDTVSALQYGNLTFGFIPQYSGLKNASFEITSDASTSPDTIFLSGTGIPSSLFISDSLLDFGSVDVGISLSLYPYIANLTASDFFINNILITGPDASQFSYSPIVSGDSLHPGGFINLTVNFSPDTAGLKTAYLVINSTSGSSPDSILLTGIGLSSLIQVQVPTSPSIGQPTPLNITAPVSAEYITKEIFYRRTGDLTYQQDSLTTIGNSYTYSIPAQYSTITGIQFYLFFNDGLNITTYPSLNPDINPASIDVSVPQMNYPDTIKTGQYQMFSVPLAINSPQIDSVFDDDYGPYNSTVWRIFRWQPEDSAYAEHNSIPGDIIPGNAFWLINKDGKTFDVNNSLSVPSFNSYTITIEPGYNQIGDPFAFPIGWLSIGNSDLILQLPIHWNADIQDYELDQDTLRPWEGYWVYNPLRQIINLNVNPNLYLGKKQSVNNFASLKDDEFLVQIKAFLNSSQAKDQLNYVGMMEDANNDINKYDVIKPPAINNQVKVLIESGKNYFARNVVPVSNNGAYWDFTIETKEGNKIVSLNVDRKSSLPDNFNIWILDKTRKVPVDVTNGSAEILTPQSGKSNLRIIVGTEDFAKLHSEDISLKAYEYALYQNYPNPFNPTTNITYQLKEKSSVTLEIFNILGERIKSIVNNIVQDPGQHIVTWNGKNSSGEKVASGIYIYRIRAKDFISSKKMILLK